MKREELDAIRKRADKATPGPWDTSIFEGLCRRETSSEMKAKLDAEFIANARQDVPALLAEVERLREALDDIANTGEDYHEYYCRDIARRALNNGEDI